MTSSLATITVVGLVVLAVLVWFFLRTRSQDMLDGIMAKRKAESKIVSRADYIEGLARIPVALALTGDTFYYENPDLQASLELKHIDEVEYDDELATGRPVEHGKRALRLRSHGTTFEFVVAPSDGPWETMLPPRRAGQSDARAS